MARPVGVLEERGMQSVSQYERRRIEKLLKAVRDETAREALGVMVRRPDGLVLVACEELRGLRR